MVIGLGKNRWIGEMKLGVLFKYICILGCWTVLGCEDGWADGVDWWGGIKEDKDRKLSDFISVFSSLQNSFFPPFHFGL